jgi:hypothetical protein
MRKRLVAAGLSAILGANGLGAQPPQFPVTPPPPFPGLPPLAPQVPPSPFPVAPMLPQPPGLLPPSLSTPAKPQAASIAPAKPQAAIGAEIALPYAEHKMALSALDVQVKRVIGGWQVWAGQKMLRDVGDSEMNARDLARALRDLRPTEWVTIGGGARPVVEYGLTNGRPAGTAVQPDEKADPNVGPANYGAPAPTGAGAKVVLPIDLRTARFEPIRGVWCVRDDNTLFFNFGTDKAGAEQTVAVIRKYGFNRVGIVGSQTQPVMSYLFASSDANGPKVLGGQLFFNAQVDALTRTGIPIPGVGFTGEMLKIDPRKVEARKEGFEWVVAAGPEVLGRFGQTEWAAREAARTIQDSRFTEYCRVGGVSNLTFFLQDGKSPTRAPFNAQGRSFDLNSLKVQQINGKWAITEGGKHLFDVGSQNEGDVVIRVLKAYGFDQTAHLSAGGTKGGINFLVKTR